MTPKNQYQMKQVKIIKPKFLKKQIKSSPFKVFLKIHFGTVFGISIEKLKNSV